MNGKNVFTHINIIVLWTTRCVEEKNNGGLEIMGFLKQFD